MLLALAGKRTCERGWRCARTLLEFGQRGAISNDFFSQAVKSNFLIREKRRKRGSSLLRQRNVRGTYCYATWPSQPISCMMFCEFISFMP